MPGSFSAPVYTSMAELQAPEHVSRANGVPDVIPSQMQLLPLRSAILAHVPAQSCHAPRVSLVL